MLPLATRVRSGSPGAAAASARITDADRDVFGSTAPTTATATAQPAARRSAALLRRQRARRARVRRGALRQPQRDRHADRGSHVAEAAARLRVESAPRRCGGPCTAASISKCSRQLHRPRVEHRSLRIPNARSPACACTPRFREKSRPPRRSTSKVEAALVARGHDPASRRSRCSRRVARVRASRSRLDPSRSAAASRPSGRPPKPVWRSEPATACGPAPTGKAEVTVAGATVRVYPNSLLRLPDGVRAPARRSSWRAARRSSTCCGARASLRSPHARGGRQRQGHALRGRRRRPRRLGVGVPQGCVGVRGDAATATETLVQAGLPGPRQRSASS